jgi:hypothetical protein
MEDVLKEWIVAMNLLLSTIVMIASLDLALTDMSVTIACILLTEAMTDTTDTKETDMTDMTEKGAHLPPDMMRIHPVRDLLTKHSNVPTFC